MIIGTGLRASTPPTALTALLPILRASSEYVIVVPYFIFLVSSSEPVYFRNC
ncbi:MAG: hypothetical protein L6282_13920 [Candidatus Methanoperedenaceae archaeon]|nr:hypothetical protein [Candidatus Methanoperedenaceae archaeon]